MVMNDTRAGRQQEPVHRSPAAVARWSIQPSEDGMRRSNALDIVACSEIWSTDLHWPALHVVHDLSLARDNRQIMGSREVGPMAYCILILFS